MEQNSIVEQLIKKNKRFIGNEDLFTKFLTETEKSLDNMQNLVSQNRIPESYLQRIVTTAVIKVLKKHNRMYRSVTTKKIPKKFKTINYNMLDFVPEPQSDDIPKMLIKSATKALKFIDMEFPQLLYNKIYELRYNQGYNLSEISKELNLTEEEVAKRIFALIDEIKKRL